MKFLGMLGMHGTFQANMAMHNADLILAIGARFDDRITNTPDKFAPNAQIVHFDVDHSSVSKIIEADIDRKDNYSIFKTSSGFYYMVV